MRIHILLEILHRFQPKALIFHILLKILHIGVGIILRGSDSPRGQTPWLILPPEGQTPWLILPPEGQTPWLILPPEGQTPWLILPPRGLSPWLGFTIRIRSWVCACQTPD